MAKYLVGKGWDVTVLTTAFQTKGAEVKDVDGIHVECIPSFPVFISEYFLRAPVVRAKLLNLCQGVLFPDLFAPWMRKVARRLKEMDYDCGILNVLPYSSFLLAQEGLFDSRWIIDYQEAIYPYLEQRPRTSPLQKICTPKLFALERKALRLCGGAWFSSKTSQARYVADGAVDGSKTEHLPYFYDPAMYPDDAPPASHDVMTVLYGGNLDSSWRSPKTFFEAWRAFMEEHPESENKVRMVLYGSMDEGCRQLAEVSGLLNKIDIRKPVPYREFLGEAKRAGVLLYIDAREQSWFNPGKLSDYFGARRPVLGFTTAGSEVEGMLANAGMAPFVAAQNDVKAGAVCMAGLWNAWKKDGGQVPLNTDCYSIFSICARVDRILQELVCRPDQRGATD